MQKKCSLIRSNRLRFLFFMSGVYLAWQQLQPHVASCYNQLTKTALTVVSYKSIFDWVWFLGPSPSITFSLNAEKQRKTPQTWIMYKMGRNFLGDIIWQDTSLCKQFIDLQLVKSFQICNLIFSLKLTL